MTATVALRITVRDLDTLDDLSGVLAAHPSLNVHGVMWHVDWDNPAWPQVRAAAIGAAIRKARDYAAALGARLRNDLGRMMGRVVRSGRFQRTGGGGSMTSAACRSARPIRSRGLTFCSSSTRSASRSRNGVRSLTPASLPVLATRPALAA